MSDYREPFFKNLRDEMERFHNKLPDGEVIRVFVACADGKERFVDTIQAIPPNILVCECDDGNSIVQHINCVQLRFAASGTITGTEESRPRKLPIGFRFSEENAQTS
jgi:hypothetical protein